MTGLIIKRTMDTNVNTITFDHQKIGSLIRHGREYELKTIKINNELELEERGWHSRW